MLLARGRGRTGARGWRAGRGCRSRGRRWLRRERNRLGCRSRRLSAREQRTGQSRGALLSNLLAHRIDRGRLGRWVGGYGLTADRRDGALRLGVQDRAAEIAGQRRAELRHARRRTSDSGSRTISSGAPAGRCCGALMHSRVIRGCVLDGRWQVGSPATDQVSGWSVRGVHVQGEQHHSEYGSASDPAEPDQHLGRKPHHWRRRRPQPHRLSRLRFSRWLGLRSL